MARPGSVSKSRAQPLGGKAAVDVTANKKAKETKAKDALITSEHLLAAVESLYADEICPHSQILKRRLVELSSNGSVRTADIDSAALRDKVATTPRLEFGAEEVRDWTVVLSDRPPSFVDVHDPCDIYAPSLWEAFGAYLAAQDSEFRLPSSRYACALDLQDRRLPFLAGLTLGRLCHVVQLSISQKSLLGYRDGALVPYEASRCMIKKQHANVMLPCAPAPAVGLLPCADWVTTRSCLAEIMAAARRSEEGVEQLANIKRIFRSKYRLELSETMLGHTKLSELLRDPKLADLCSVELRNGGYAVVPGTGAWAVGQFTDCIAQQNNTAADAFSMMAMQPLMAQPFVPRSDHTSSIAVDNRGDTFGGLQLSLSAEAREPPKPVQQSNQKLKPWQLSPSTLSKDGSITKVPGGSAVKNTFIDVPATPWTPAVSTARRRSHSLPKDMGSKKSEWETACHVLSYQHRPVQPEVVRVITVDKMGCGLGLDVSRDGDALLVEGIGPGAIQWWNVLHPVEAVMPGDRIVNVNGVTGDAMLLLQACGAAGTLRLTVLPSQQTITRKCSEPALPSPVPDLPVCTPSFDTMPLFMYQQCIVPPTESKLPSPFPEIPCTPSLDMMPVCSYAIPEGKREGPQLHLANFL